MLFRAAAWFATSNRRCFDYGRRRPSLNMPIDLRLDVSPLGDVARGLWRYAQFAEEEGVVEGDLL